MSAQARGLTLQRTLPNLFIRGEETGKKPNAIRSYSLRTFGTGSEQVPLIELGTPNLGRIWEITNLVFSYKEVSAQVASWQENTAFAIAAELLVASVSNAKELTQAIRMTEPAGGVGKTSTSKLRTIASTINLPQPVIVPGGQACYLLFVFEPLEGRIFPHNTEEGGVILGGTMQQGTASMGYNRL